MPRLFGRSVMSNSMREDIPPSEHYLSSASWADLHLSDVIYNNSSSDDEPEIFNERVDYPEDTPEAVRIRLANLEEIERRLEQERRNVLVEPISSSPTIVRTVLREGGSYNYWSDGVIHTFTTNQNMIVELHREHMNDIGYVAEMLDIPSFGIDGEPYILRRIRYTLRERSNSELAGTSFSPYIVNTAQTSANTDVGQVRLVTPRNHYQTLGGGWV